VSVGERAFVLFVIFKEAQAFAGRSVRKLVLRIRDFLECGRERPAKRIEREPGDFL
jgi:hypothetical protein